MTQADPATAGRRSLAAPQQGSRATTCPTCGWHNDLAALNVESVGYLKPVALAKLRTEHAMSGECQNGGPK